MTVTETERAAGPVESSVDDGGERLAASTSRFPFRLSLIPLQIVSENRLPENMGCSGRRPNHLYGRLFPAPESRVSAAVTLHRRAVAAVIALFVSSPWSLLTLRSGEAGSWIEPCRASTRVENSRSSLPTKCSVSPFAAHASAWKVTAFASWWLSRLRCRPPSSHRCVADSHRARENNARSQRAGCAVTCQGGLIGTRRPSGSSTDASTLDTWVVLLS